MVVPREDSWKKYVFANLFMFKDCADVCLGDRRKKERKPVERSIITIMLEKSDRIFLLSITVRVKV
jgi:hypothetical protein